MIPRRIAPAALAVALLVSPASAQTFTTTQGTCERLSIAGTDLTATCRPSLRSLVYADRSSFDFAAEDGRTLSFSGPGAGPAPAARTDPQTVDLAIPGQIGKAGIARSPTPATGSCRFSTPETGRTRIACEASAQGKTYAASFLTEAKPEAKPDVKPAPGAQRP